MPFQPLPRAPNQLAWRSAEQALAPHLRLEGVRVVVSPLVLLHVQLRCRMLLLPPRCIRFHVGWQLIGVCQLCPAWDNEVVSPVANGVVLPAWSGKINSREVIHGLKSVGTAERKSVKWCSMHRQAMQHGNGPMQTWWLGMQHACMRGHGKPCWWILGAWTHPCFCMRRKQAPAARRPGALRRRAAARAGPHGPHPI